MRRSIVATRRPTGSWCVWSEAEKCLADGERQFGQSQQSAWQGNSIWNLLDRLTHRLGRIRLYPLRVVTGQRWMASRACVVGVDDPGLAAPAGMFRRLISVMSRVFISSALGSSQSAAW